MFNIWSAIAGLQQFEKCSACSGDLIPQSASIHRRIFQDYSLDLAKKRQYNGPVKNHPLYMRHNIDSAMSSLWEFYKKRFLSLFLISFAMSLAIQYISTLINVQELSSITDPMVMLEKIKEMIIPILIISVVNLLFNVVLQYYILFNPLEQRK